MKMQNQTPQTSFKSTIRIVEPNSFIMSVNKIYHNEVAYPWTIKESKILKDVYTRGVYDCGVVGIKNGSNALLMHICPTEPNNFDFVKIRDFILEKINQLRNDCIQGFVLGGKSNVMLTKSPRSMEYINGFCEIFKSEGVPFSKMVGGEYWNDVAYFTEKDTLLIGNERADNLHKIFPDDPLDAAKVIFDDIQLCDLDTISW